MRIRQEIEDRTGNLISTGFARDFHMQGELALTESEIREMTEAYKAAGKGIAPEGFAPAGAPSLEEQAAAELDRRVQEVGAAELAAPPRVRVRP